MTGPKLLRMEPILPKSTLSKAAAGTAAGADAGTVERMFVGTSAGEGMSGGTAEESVVGMVAGTAAEEAAGVLTCGSVAADGSLFAGIGVDTAGWVRDCFCSSTEMKEVIENIQ